MLSSQLCTAQQSAEALTVKHGVLGLGQLSIVKDGKVLGGLKVELLDAIAERLGWQVDHSYCPFQRCLRSMAGGELDIMVFIAVNDSRSQYLDYIQVWSIPRKMPFYMLEGQEHRLQNYQDLYQLRVGVVNGYSYFKRFDEDTQIEKVVVQNEKQLPRMIIAGRIDTYIAFDQRREQLLLQYPQLIAPPFNHAFSDTALLAISKSSPLAQHSKELEIAALSVIKDGTMAALWKKFLGEDQPPYPSHLAPNPDTQGSDHHNGNGE
ncbi:MAG: substrate-binding periplasmic protein [Cellvibrionaceae bacterium]